MAEPPASFAEQLRVLQAAFLADLPARYDALCAPWADASLGWPERIQRMHAVSHQLAGVAGTFGFEDLGRAARALDDHLKTRLGQATAPDPDPIPEHLEILGNAIHQSR